jgi:benzoyl-CoA reductase/2-hydroxyglutaryl-CoA dehydratase subunit BcrC/BadD/HgdB
MKRVVYTSCYVPGPWIAAHGLEPCLLPVKGLSDRESNGPVEGVCAYVRAFVSEVLADETIGAVVLTTTCDQMRRAFDWIISESRVPVFLMTIPRLQASSYNRDLYRKEVERLGRFLEDLGGHSPCRETLGQALTASCEPETHCPLASDRDKVRLALVGGPLAVQDRTLFTLVESCGGQVVLDATETGLLGQPNGQPGDSDDPWEVLIRRYFVQRWDVGRRPNGELYDWLKPQLEAVAVKGVLFRWNLWCDLWHGELACFKQHIDLPVLGIEATGNFSADQPRLLTRIGAFVEMFK